MSALLSRGWMRRALLVIGAVASIGALAGCGDEYDRTEISAVVPSKLSSNDPNQVINTQRLTIPEGMIIKAHIVVWNDDNVQMPLEIRSSNNSMVEIASVVSDRDYAFIGKAQGTTTVQFLADGKPVVTIEATVIPQPSP